MDTTAIHGAISFDAEPVPHTSTPSERGFWSLIVTQFQGAYSDNILRNLLLSMMERYSGNFLDAVDEIEFLFVIDRCLTCHKPKRAEQVPDNADLNCS